MNDVCKLRAFEGLENGLEVLGQKERVSGKKERVGGKWAKNVFKVENSGCLFRSCLNLAIKNWYVPLSLHCYRSGHNKVLGNNE